jgi:thiol-disulfide isomerase/thioredoxin
MAKSFSSKKDDKFLIYLIVGFASVIVALVAGLVIYNIVADVKDYDDFDHISSFNNITDQSEDQYLVYYYSETCGYCNQIKNQVIKFADSNNQNIKVYMMDANEAFSTSFPIYDPDTGAEMTGTPSLITVVDGQIVHMAPGYIEVTDTLESINAGTYNYLD